MTPVNQTSSPALASSEIFRRIPRPRLRWMTGAGDREPRDSKEKEEHLRDAHLRSRGSAKAASATR
jgi:hypothetical protein